MLTTTATIDDFISTARTVAGENPDYVYKSPESNSRRCFYDRGVCGPDDDDVGCIWGRVMRKLGMDISSLDGNYSTTIVGVLRELFGVNDENRQKIYWCRAVQGEQDDQHPWGECIEIADKEYPLV